MKKWFYFLSAALFLAAALFTGMAVNANAATITVTSTADSGAGTLRNAISSAASSDTINFNLTYPATITLSSELTINKNLTITGPGADKLTISGNNSVRIFYITSGTITISGITAANGRTSAVVDPGAAFYLFNSGISLTVNDCVIRNNAVTGSQANGVGFFATTGSTLTINRSYIHSNQGVTTNCSSDGSSGGAVLSGGTLTINNSTLSNNQACIGPAISATGGSITLLSSTISGNHSYSDTGAAVFIQNVTSTITNTTITGNIAEFYESGLSAWCLTSLTMKNTIVAGNNSLQPLSGDSDIYFDDGTWCSGNAVTFISGGYNLIGSEGFLNYTWVSRGTSDIVGEEGAKQNAGLNTTLSDNGGYTQTHALNAGSIAINPASSNGAPWVDQRGYLRNGNSDKGAYEYSGTLPVATAATGVAATSFSANWNSVTGATGYRLDVATDSGFTSLVAGFNDLDVGNVTTQSVTGLSAGTTYYYRIRAYNGSYLSYHSNTVTATTGAVVTNVSSSTANGTYGIGDTIAVTVTFSQAVDVTNTPTLLLETGATDRTASYATGGGTATLTFNYTVQSGDSIGDLDYVATNSLSLSGGTIKDTGGTDAILTLPSPGAAGSLGANKNIVIDGIAPAVTSVSVPANGTYIAGQNLDFTVNWDEAVNVDTAGGTPYIELTLDTGGTVNASYVSGSGTGALVFRYTIAGGYADTNGITVGGSITLNGGAIDDTADNDANPNLNSVGSTAGVLVDAIAPTVSSVSVPANGTYTAGQNLDFTVNYSEAVTVNTGGGTPYIQITLDTGGVVNASFISGGGTSALVFRYTVASGNEDTNGVTVGGSITANGGTLRDAAGNNATLTLNSVGSTAGVIVDAVAPAITFSALSFSADTGISSTDFITNTAAQTIGAALSAALGAGDVVYGSLDNGSTWTDITGKVSGTTLLWNGVALTGSSSLMLKVTDSAGNDGAVASQAYVLDTAAPTIVVSGPSVADTISGPVDYTVTYSDTNFNTSTLATGNITLNKTGTADATTVAVTGSGATRTVTISGITGTGTIGISIAAGTATDIAGNTAPAAGPSTTFLVCSGSAITVTDIGDSGPGTLRQAIYDICPGGTIDFGITGTITLTSGELSIDKDMTIDGAGAASLTVSGNNASRVFNIPSGTVSISELTVTKGIGTGGGGIYNVGTLAMTNSTVSGNLNYGIGNGGGGIYNIGTLTVTNSTVSGNYASFGNVSAGGIYNVGTLTVTNSTVSGNRADAIVMVGGSAWIGGIYNAGTLTVTNSTISGNIVPGGFGIYIGGIYNAGGTATMRNSIVAANNAGGNCSWSGAAITDGGNNIDDAASCGFSAPSSMSSTDPLLDPAGLQNNGGPTQTIAILAGSPAINAGAGCPLTDQRGISRPQGSACDIGAYEAEWFNLSITKAGTGAGTVTGDVTGMEGDGINCGANCSETYSLNTVVTLAATPNAGSSFTGWSGDADCSDGAVTMTANRACTATFTLIPPPAAPVVTTYTVTLQPTTGGSIFPSTSQTVNEGGIVTFTITPNTGNHIGSVSGCGGRLNGNIYVTAPVRASCAVTVVFSPDLTFTDPGIPGIKREDAAGDDNNLVNGNPDSEVWYTFEVNVTTSGGTPQQVRLVINHGGEAGGIWYTYDMQCTGDFLTGATCRYTTKLGPSSGHNYYFEVVGSDGTVSRYPSTGHITGPVVELMNGYNMVGIPKDLSGVTLDGMAAFGTGHAYRWRSSGLTRGINEGEFIPVDITNPVKTGEGYYVKRETLPTLPELSGYPDVSAQSYEIPLAPGWNIISNPYGGNVRLSDTLLKKGSETPVPWLDAAAQGLVVNAIYHYRGKDFGGGFSTESAGRDPEATLAPWLGYWLYLNSTDAYALTVRKP